MKRLLASLWSYAVLQGMAIVLLPLLLLRHHGAAWAGAGYASSVFPYVVFGLPAGRIGDRMDRKLLLALALLLPIAACALLVVVEYGRWPGLWILLSGILIGSAQPFVDSAVFGALSGGQDHRRKLSFAVAGGPAGRVLGALLVALALWIGNGTLAAGIMLAVSLLALLFCLSTPLKTTGVKTGNNQARPWRELFHDRRLRQLIFSGVLWNLLAVMLIGGASVALLKLILGWNDHQIALLFGIGTCGAFIASMLSPKITASSGPWAAITRSTGGALLLAILFCTSTALQLPTLLSATFFVLMLFVNQIYITNLMVERQHLAPADSRSSVATASRMVTWLGAAAGVVGYSILIDHLGAQLVGWLCCAGGLLTWSLMLRWWGISALKASSDTADTAG